MGRGHDPVRPLLCVLAILLAALACGQNALTRSAQVKLDAAAKTGGKVTLAKGLYDAPLYLRPQGTAETVEGVEVECTGPFSSLKKGHDGPFLVTVEAKDCTFRLPILGFGKGVGIQVTGMNSTSRLDFTRCHFQDLDRGISLEAGTDGTDICATVVEKCQFTLCDIGLKVDGSNALDPVVLASWFSDCGIALDFRSGGSNAKVIACGGSYCKEFVVIKAGYQASIDVTSFEGSNTETFLRVGGPDAGGFGSFSAVSVTALDVRTVKDFAVLNCSGSVSLQAHKASGLLRGDNKSSAVCGLVLSGATGKLVQAMTGKFDVKVQ